MNCHLAGPVNCTKAPPTFVIINNYLPLRQTGHNIIADPSQRNTPKLHNTEIETSKSIMSRPGVARTASTNLGSANGNRVLDGKIAIVTGASRGMRQLSMKVQMEQLLTKIQVLVPQHAKTSPPRAVP